MMDLGCVDAMRGVRGDLVEEIADLDGLAQKCILFSVHNLFPAQRSEKFQASQRTKCRKVRTSLGWL